MFGFWGGVFLGGFWGFFKERKEKKLKKKKRGKIISIATVFTIDLYHLRELTPFILAELWLALFSESSHFA